MGASILSAEKTTLAEPAAVFECGGKTITLPPRIRSVHAGALLLRTVAGLARNTGQMDREVGSLIAEISFRIEDLTGDDPDVKRAVTDMVDFT